MKSRPYHLNGLATRGARLLVKNKTAQALTSVHWSSTEYSQTNAWNVNFSSGNVNNNNKYNSYVVRAVAALESKDVEDMIDAYVDCCRNKKTSRQCTLYRLIHEEDLIRLASEIKRRTYTPSTSITFVVTRPKLREIFAANFRDRIVQHWITMRIEPLLEARFIETGDASYNCRKGYGTLRASRRAQELLRHKPDGVVAKFDIQSFFMSVDIDILWSLLSGFVKERYEGSDKDTLLWLIELVVHHRPQENSKRNGDISLWKELPKAKSLFSNEEGKGMPIGNITSQLLANFYMSYFDEWVMNRYHGIGYIRFVDDFIIVADAPDQITAFARDAKRWLSENLALNMHKDKVYIQPVRHGVSFVGSVIYTNRIYISNRTFGHLRCKMEEFNKMCENFDPPEARRMLMSINALLGFARHCNSMNQRVKLLRGLGMFWQYAKFDSRIMVVKIRNKYKLATIKQMEYELQVFKREA